MLEYEELHLDVLLRDKRISGSIATSLMNDTALVRSSVKLLKEVVVVLKKYQTPAIKLIDEVDSSKQAQASQEKPAKN